MIRPAQPGDAVAVARLVHDAYAHYVERLGKPPGPMLDDYATLIAHSKVWVLEDAGTLAAILVLDDAGEDGLLLDNIAVAPGSQGRGYGRQLMDFAQAEAARRGKHEVRLYTHVLMTENLALYLRLGFHETGRVTEKGFDRVYMAKAVA